MDSGSVLFEVAKPDGAGVVPVVACYVQNMHLLSTPVFGITLSFYYLLSHSCIKKLQVDHKINFDKLD